MKKGSLHSFETKNKMKENHPTCKWNKKDYINLVKQQTNKLHVYTEQRREKMRIAMKNRKVSWGDKISKSLTGQKLSKEHIEKSRQGNIKNWRDPIFYKMHSGKNSPAWKDGRSFYPYSLEFTKKLRAFIKKRDNYICQLCGTTQNEQDQKILLPHLRLTIHHIDHNKQNNHSFNLITLCRSCNAKVNFNEKYYIKLFDDYISDRLFKKIIPALKVNRAQELEKYFLSQGMSAEKAGKLIMKAREPWFL